MNWLAHLVLSEPSPEFQLGNLLPDLMTRAELAALPAAFQPGIECHRRIDAFTDSHAVVHRSVRRISPPHRRFAPILVDVFYDHFLSTKWHQHHPRPLDEFLAEVYESFDEPGGHLPPPTRSILQRMRIENWLGSYGDMAGVRRALERISLRFRRRVSLGEAVGELERHYAALASDFSEFFPDLRAAVEFACLRRDSLSSVRACP